MERGIFLRASALTQPSEADVSAAEACVPETKTGLGEERGERKGERS
jgi:hypothetical protein